MTGTVRKLKEINEQYKQIREDLKETFMEQLRKNVMYKFDKPVIFDNLIETVFAIHHDDELSCGHVFMVKNSGHSSMCHANMLTDQELIELIDLLERKGRRG